MTKIISATEMRDRMLRKLDVNATYGTIRMYKSRRIKPSFKYSDGRHSGWTDDLGIIADLSLIHI